MKYILFSISILIVSTGCKKETLSIPTSVAEPKVYYNDLSFIEQLEYLEWEVDSGLREYWVSPGTQSPTATVPIDIEKFDSTQFVSFIYERNKPSLLYISHSPNSNDTLNEWDYPIYSHSNVLDSLSFEFSPSSNSQDPLMTLRLTYIDSSRMNVYTFSNWSMHHSGNYHTRNGRQYFLSRRNIPPYK